MERRGADSLIRADRLGAGVTLAAVDTTVQDHLRAINVKIRKHHGQLGQFEIAHDIVSIPSYAGVDRIAAERLIFTSIMKGLEDRGYQVEIALSDAEHEATRIIIRWVTGFDEKQVEAMNDYISRRRVPWHALAPPGTVEYRPPPTAITPDRLQGRAFAPDHGRDDRLAGRYVGADDAPRRAPASYYPRTMYDRPT